MLKPKLTFLSLLLVLTFGFGVQQIFLEQLVYAQRVISGGPYYDDARTNWLFSHKHCAIQWFNLYLYPSGHARWEAYAESDGSGNSYGIDGLTFTGNHGTFTFPSFGSPGLPVEWDISSNGPNWVQHLGFDPNKYPTAGTLNWHFTRHC